MAADNHSDLEDTSIDENKPNNTFVGPDPVVQAGDPDEGTTLTYSIEPAHEIFDIGNTDADRGKLFVKDNTKLNFEYMRSHILTIRVDDGSLSKEANVTIRVDDINEAPHVEDTEFRLNECVPNDTFVGMVAANDPDAGATLTYQIKDDAGNWATTDGTFNIDASGRITVANSGNLSSNDGETRDLDVRVSDGSLHDEGAITVRLNRINARPFFDPWRYPLSGRIHIDHGAVMPALVVDTNADDYHGDELTYSITSGDVDDLFTINVNDGEITLARDASNASRASYQLTIQASDGELRDTAPVFITINGITGDEPNDPPVVHDATFSVLERATGGTVVEAVSANDPDGDTLTYKIKKDDGSLVNDDGTFKVNSSNGLIQVSPTAVLDYESDPEVPPQYTLTIQVDDGTNAPVTGTITIDVEDLNEGPTFDPSVYEVKRGRHLKAGDLVVDTNASDPEGGSLQYEIVAGNEEDLFEIEQSNGKIKLKKDMMEAQASTYNLTVEVTDGYVSSNAPVTITVHDSVGMYGETQAIEGSDIEIIDIWFQRFTNDVASPLDVGYKITRYEDNTPDDLEDGDDKQFFDDVDESYSFAAGQTKREFILKAKVDSDLKPEMFKVQIEDGPNYIAVNNRHTGVDGLDAVDIQPVLVMDIVGGVTL